MTTTNTQSQAPDPEKSQGSDQARVTQDSGTKPQNPLRSMANIKTTILSIKQQKPVIDVSNPNIATNAQTEQFLNALERIVSTSPLTQEQKTALLLGVCELFQKGAVSPKFDKMRRSQVYPGLVVGQMQDAVKAVDRSLTLRKIARNLKREILEVAKEWSIPGNLAKKYSQFEPNATISDLIWASDFFTFSDDKEMPDQVRDWLIKNYSSRFNK